MVNLRALLIGIGHYDENEVCDSLEGAVADVEAMEDFLLRQGVSRERICKLTVSNDSTGRPPEPRDEWPTYENMVAAIQRLTAVAEPGEHVLIHYCGHGGRIAPTLIPELKGSGGIDEGLIPANVGQAGARYLRDVELTCLLYLMVEKGLLVTLVFDACHSAGLFRGKAGLRARGSRKLDRSTPPLDSLVASRRELKETWQRVHNRAYRGASTSGWLAAAEGLVLLAACRSVETAYEYPFAGRFRGLLTYCLLEVLAGEGGDLCFQQIHNRLIGRIHHYAPHQTPVLEGDVTRRVFGGHLRALLDGIEVLEVDPGGGRVRLGAGHALGISQGALLRICPSRGGRRERSSADRRDHPRRPLVKITETGAFESWGTATDQSGVIPQVGKPDTVAKVRRGDLAVLIDPGDRCRRQVVLVPPERAGALAAGGWRSGTASAAAETLGEVRQELERRAGGFLELVEDVDSGSGRAPDFQVTVKRQRHGRAGATTPEPREVEIWSSDGKKVTDLPPLPVTAPNTAVLVAESLLQLAKFHNVRDLENRDNSSPLNGALTVELGLLPEGFAAGRDLEPQPFGPRDPLPEIKSGQWICLTIANQSEQALEITVLDLQPGWTIEQIHPLTGSETLEGGIAVRLPFEIYLPVGFRSGREVIKVFGTTDPADFRWLRLPAIGTPRRLTRSGLGTPSDPLERLFAEIARDGPPARSTQTHLASRYWTSAQVELEVGARSRSRGFGRRGLLLSRRQND